MPYHRSKKSYFCHTFHLRPKKVFWWVGGGGGWWWVKSDFSVSLCPFSFGHTDTEMDTELDKNFRLNRVNHKMEMINAFYLFFMEKYKSGQFVFIYFAFHLTETRKTK